ncbi:MAG: hypothetical protein F4X87_01305 [Chloroflexi bacterium]|nr:hypothetical protein [Chloroflexota bacterium]
MSESADNSEIFPQSKWWWLGLALLLCLAGWLYLRGLHVSLPFIEHLDEAHNMLEAQHIIDAGHARGVTRESYPPGMRSVIYPFLKHLKPDGAHHGTMIAPLRLVTVGAWTFTIIVIALLGAMIAHPMTGLMAAAIWIVNPWVLQRVPFVLPDGYLTLFSLLAIWLALVGVLHGRRSFNTAAVYSIMLAIVFKTQAILIAPIIVLLPLLNWRREPSRRKDAWQQAFWNCLRFALFLCWLLVLYPTLEAPKHIYQYPVTELRIVIPSPDTVWQGLSQLLQTFQPLTVWLLVALSGGLLYRYRQQVNGIALVAIILSALAWLLGTHIVPTRGFHLRQYFPMGAMLAILFATGMTSLIFLLDEALTPLAPRWLRLFQRFRLVSPAGITAILFIIGLLPAYLESNALAHNFTLHDRRNDLMSYMDTSLPPGKYVADWSGPYHKVMNRSWGGYTGLHDYPLAQGLDYLKGKPIDEWRARDAVYAIVPYRTADFLRFPEETFALKHYPTDPNFRDPGMTVLRLYPMQREADGQLGSIHLVGYDLNASEVAAGEDIIFRQYWRAEKPTNTAHRVGNYLLNDNREVVAQVDYVPLWDARRDTRTWDDPDEILIGREFTLRVPSDLPPATYQLSFGFYDTASRLLSPEGSDLMEITEITVVSPEV